MIFSHIKRSFLFLIPQKYLPKENKMFTCNSYLNDVITYRASHYSLSQVLFQVLAILQILKLTWSLALFSGKASWMSYMSFSRSCASHAKSHYSLLFFLRQICFFRFDCTLTIFVPLLLLRYIYLNEQFLKDRKCPSFNNVAE